MEQRLSMVTLGVAVLERAKAFYEDVVGWTALARLKPLFRSRWNCVLPISI